MGLLPAGCILGGTLFAARHLEVDQWWFTCKVDHNRIYPSNCGIEAEEPHARSQEKKNWSHPSTMATISNSDNDDYLNGGKQQPVIPGPLGSATILFAVCLLFCPLFCPLFSLYNTRLLPWIYRPECNQFSGEICVLYREPIYL